MPFATAACSTRSLRQNVPDHQVASINLKCSAACYSSILKHNAKKNWRVELALAAIDCTVFGFPTEMLHIWKLLLVTLTKHFAQQNIHTDIEQTHQGTPRSTASAAGEEEEKERKKEGVAPLVICKNLEALTWQVGANQKATMTSSDQDTSRVTLDQCKQVIVQ